MQSLRDATALLILILLALSVRVTPADPQAETLKGVQAATQQASLLPIDAEAPPVQPAVADSAFPVNVECNVDPADFPDEASGVVVILEIERDGSVLRKVLVADPAPGHRAGTQDC